jgi:hypothetical protein
MFQILSYYGWNSWEMQFVIVNSNTDEETIFMKKKKQDLIYIYDTEHHKIIVIDSETGDRIKEEDDQVTSLLKYLDEENNPILLRKFAVWCARQINDELKPIQKKLLDLAEKAIQQETNEQALQELYEETEGTAIATDTTGLMQGNENAPAYLAARESINPDPLEGAIQAARFHRLWAEMKDNKDEFDDITLKEVKAEASKSAIQKAEQEQTNHLLDLMNE